MSLEICKLLYQTCVHVRPVIVMQVWQDLCFLDLAVPSDFSLHLGRGTGLTSTAFLRQRVLEGNKDFKSPKPETITHVLGRCVHAQAGQHRQFREEMARLSLPLSTFTDVHSMTVSFGHALAKLRFCSISPTVCWESTVLLFCIYAK